MFPAKLRHNRPIIHSTVAALLLLAATTAPAAYSPPDTDLSLDDPDSTGPAIILDLILVRPLGVVATVLGSVFFVAGLPFAAAAQDFETPRYFLVEQPARFTFQRPLGHLSDD